VRAATQAAWLQVVAAREQLEVCEALSQFIVTVLRHVAVCDGKCAFASHAAVLEHGSHGGHFLFPVKWERYYKSYLEEAVPWWKVILTRRAAAKANAATQTSFPRSAALPRSTRMPADTHSHGLASRLCHLMARNYVQSKWRLA
jgi:hypothetical protein